MSNAASSKRNWTIRDREISLLDDSDRTDLQYAEWCEEQERDALKAAKWEETKAAYAEIFDKQRKGGVR